MNYLIKDEENGKLIIYECNPIPDKIYEYRKNEIENLTHPIATAVVSYKYGNIEDKKSIEEKWVDLSYCKLLDADKKQILLQEKKNLLESYYNGEIFKNGCRYISRDVMICPHNNYNHYIKFETLLLPNNLTISYDFYNEYYFYENYYYTNDIIHINEKLSILESIRTGSIQFSNYINDISNQLECFNFSIVDEIRLSALNKLLSDKKISADSPYRHTNNSLTYIDDRAEAGQKILSMIKKSN